MKRFKPKPAISKKDKDRLQASLSELRELPIGTFAEAELCMDQLASALRDVFFGKDAKPLKMRAPALYEVVERLAIDFGLDDDAVDAAYELKNHIEDTYQPDRDEVVFYDVEDSAEILAALLENFVK
jgi:hypothetical protein